MHRGITVLVAAAVLATAAADFARDQKEVAAAPKKTFLAALPYWWGSGDTTESAHTTEPPPEVHSTNSILHIIQEAILRQLRDHSSQQVNALIALAFGLALVLDGEFVFKWILVAGAFITATIISHNESAAYWDLPEENPLRRFTGIEVGLVCAYVTYRGIEAAQLIVATLFGLYLAHNSQKFMVAHGAAALHDAPVLVVAWYSFFIFACLLAVGTKKYLKALGALSSLFGGPLIASALCYFLAHAANTGAIKTAAPVVAAPWINFLLLLLNLNDQPDVGIFANYEGVLNNFAETGWPFDRIFGCMLWFVCFAFGTVFQAKRKAARTEKVAARGLEEPLLQE